MVEVTHQQYFTRLENRTAILARCFAILVAKLDEAGAVRASDVAFAIEADKLGDHEGDTFMTDIADLVRRCTERLSNLGPLGPRPVNED